MRLATDGADIIGLDLCADIASTEYPMGTRDELDETVALVESTGRRMIGSVADVRDFYRVREVIDAGVAELGRLDIVCANAGIAPMSFRRLTVEEELAQWSDVVGVNLSGTFNTVQAALPHVISGGRGGAIILISSTAGLRGFGGATGGGLGYSASKHGVVGLIRALANHLAGHSIRVNTIHPTAVRTMMAMNPTISKWLESNPNQGVHLKNPMPVDMLEPEDISAAVAFLASDEAKWITGVTVPVDAGFTNRV